MLLTSPWTWEVSTNQGDSTLGPFCGPHIKDGETEAQKLSSMFGVTLQAPKPLILTSAPPAPGPEGLCLVFHFTNPGGNS